MSVVVAILAGDAAAGKALAEEFGRRGDTGFPGDTRAPTDVARAVRDARRGVDLLIVYPATQAPDPDYPDLDFALLRQTYDRNALDVLRSVETMLPLMPQGAKRLCFVVEQDPLQDELATTNDLGDAMAKAAVTMAYKNLFNDLRRGGYTFRLFRPENAGEAFAGAAADYFLSERRNEDVLVIHAADGRETVL